MKGKLFAIGSMILLTFVPTSLFNQELSELRTLIFQQESESQVELEPFQDFFKSGSDSDFVLGKQLISRGKVGCLIIAGGQGTRLRHSGPKGTFPVTIVKNKSLFQVFAEKVHAAGKQAMRKLPLAIMTSSNNHAETVQFFEDHHYFGLEPRQVVFFMQKDLPFLNKDGELFLDHEGKIAMGPDGNAASLKQFYDTGIWSNWQQQGVQFINFILIDNPLADPFDAELVGFHYRQEADIAMKCIEREDPMEKVGVIVKKNGKVHVVEYSEISEEERMAREVSGDLKHRCANISLFSFTMDFIREIGKHHYGKLPYHKAWKAIPLSEKMAWKFEKFIFDVLPYAEKIQALLVPRQECFAPLKNAEGRDSIEHVQAALLQRDRQIFSAITGHNVESQAFELDPQFYYPTLELLHKWRGHSLPRTSYIEP